MPAPDLARSWTSSADGDTWTLELDPTAQWHDGAPVTSADVVFTIETLQDPAYRGPGAGSWTGIEATAVDSATVRFTLTTPIGGFLDVASLAIAPAHLLGATPADALPDDPFGSAPIGSGPYAVTELDRDHAVLELASLVTTPAETDAASPADSSLDPLATPAPTPRPSDSDAPLDRITFRFFDDIDALTSAWRAGELDAASGLDPSSAAELARTPGSRAIRHSGTTLSAVLVNLRPTAPTLADPRVRLALLQAIDRGRIVGVVDGGMATAADGLIPPTSWAYVPAPSSGLAGASPSPTATAKPGKSAPPPASPRASAPPSGAAPGPTAPPSARPSTDSGPAADPKGAVANLTDAGWKKAADGWRPTASAAAPKTLELLVPDRSADAALFATGSQVAADWRAIGLDVEVVERDPAVIATDHLRTGDFELAVVDIAIGHDPDLYPLLASSQTRTGGANVVGLQDPALDALLEAARAPGDEAARTAAFRALQARLATGTYLLPLAWPNVVTVVSDRVIGPAPRPVADGSERFGDVLTWRLANGR
jgi:peptide/nickel transport system substrate-binding protein